MYESHKRTLIKTIIWRVIATLTTILFSYIFTGNISKSLKIGIIDNMIKLLLYYGYERIFTNLKWGLIEPKKIEVELSV